MEPHLSTPADPVSPVAAREVPGGGAAPEEGAAKVETPAKHGRWDLDAEFVEWLAERHRYLRLTKYAYLVCGDRHLAEDLAQEASAKIFKVWADDARRDHIKKTEGYVFTAVRSAFLDFRAVPSRTNEFESEISEPAGPKLMRDVVGELDLDTVWTIRDAVRQLDDDARVLVFLVYYEGENVSAAGRALGLTANQAHRLHEKSKAQLRLLLSSLKEKEDEWTSRSVSSKMPNPSRKKSRRSTSENS